MSLLNDSAFLWGLVYAVIIVALWMYNDWAVWLSDLRAWVNRRVQVFYWRGQGWMFSSLGQYPQKETGLGCLYTHRWLVGPFEVRVWHRKWWKA